jgi:acetylornithine deacetylase/succinyl-diaminopimelate desuccinylase-like protein
MGDPRHEGPEGWGATNIAGSTGVDERLSIENLYKGINATYHLTYKLRAKQP